MSFVGNFTNDDFNSTIGSSSDSGNCNDFYGIILQPYSYVGWSQLSYFFLETVSLGAKDCHPSDKMSWFFLANCIYATVGFVLFCVTLDATHSPWIRYQQLLVRISNSSVLSCFISFFTKSVMYGETSVDYLERMQRLYPLPGFIMGFPLLIMMPAICTHIIPGAVVYIWVPFLALFAYTLVWSCAADCTDSANNREAEEKQQRAAAAQQQQLAAFHATVTNIMQRLAEQQQETNPAPNTGDSAANNVEMGSTNSSDIGHWPTWTPPSTRQQPGPVQSNHDLPVPWRLIVAIAIRITLALTIQMLINYMILFYDGHGYVSAMKMEYHYRITGSTCYYDKMFDDMAQALSFFSWL